MKQTSVQWLAIEYNRIDNKWKNVGQGQKHCATEKAEALKQAKEMEKETMLDFAKYCLNNAKYLNFDKALFNVEEYYQIFKSE